jgi:hypothetical protein
MLRLALAFSAAAVLAFAAAWVVWLRTHVVPPNCEDSATLAQVRQGLTNHFALPAAISIEHIRMLAGGYVAFRFVCEADIAGIDRNSLPPGTPVPGMVQYTSQLTNGHSRHEVTVSIEPRIRWERVQ